MNLKDGVIVMKGSRVGVEDEIVNGRLVVGVCVPVSEVEVDADVHWVGSCIFVELGSTGRASVETLEHEPMRNMINTVKNIKIFIPTSQIKNTLSAKSSNFETINILSCMNIYLT